MYICHEILQIYIKVLLYLLISDFLTTSLSTEIVTAIPADISITSSSLSQKLFKVFLRTLLILMIINNRLLIFNNNNNANDINNLEILIVLKIHERLSRILINKKIDNE